MTEGLRRYPYDIEVQFYYTDIVCWSYISVIETAGGCEPCVFNSLKGAHVLNGSFVKSL